MKISLNIRVPENSVTLFLAILLGFCGLYNYGKVYEVLTYIIITLPIVSIIGFLFYLAIIKGVSKSLGAGFIKSTLPEDVDEKFSEVKKSEKKFSTNYLSLASAAVAAAVFIGNGQNDFALVFVLSVVALTLLKRFVIKDLQNILDQGEVKDD